MWGTDQSILVVDDDPGCRELHRHWLEADHDVETVASGEAALERVSSETDLVLLDREMPGMTGSEVLESLTEMAFEGYVVMVTGVRPDFDIVEMPIDDYLVKPISERELTAVVERLGARAEYHEQLRELFSLAARKARLEVEKEPPELARSAEYDRLRDRLAEKRAALIATIADGDGQWEAALEACLPEQRRSSGAV